MAELDYLARSNSDAATLAAMGLLVLRILVVSFLVYLVGQVIAHIPYLQSHMEQSPGKLIIFLLLLLLAIFLTWNLPALRILHEMELISKSRAFLWPDIIISGLVIQRLSYLWPGIFGWFARQTS